LWPKLGGVAAHRRYGKVSWPSTSETTPVGAGELAGPWWVLRLQDSVIVDSKVHSISANLLRDCTVDSYTSVSRWKPHVAFHCAPCAAPIALVGICPLAPHAPSPFVYRVLSQSLASMPGHAFCPKRSISPSRVVSVFCNLMGLTPST
jgi:hypothetical protein